MYDFHKCRVTGQDHSFKHPLFLRGRPDLLKEIHRKNSESNWPVQQRSSFSKAELSPLLQKLYQLHRRSQSSDSEIQRLEDKVAELTEQNRVLASQFWETKEKMRGIEQVLVMMATYIQTTGQDMPSQLFLRDNSLSITHIPGEPEKRQKTEDPLEGILNGNHPDRKEREASSNEEIYKQDELEVDEFFNYENFDAIEDENLDFLLDNN